MTSPQRDASTVASRIDLPFSALIRSATAGARSSARSAARSRMRSRSWAGVRRHTAAPATAAVTAASASAGPARGTVPTTRPSHGEVISSTAPDTAARRSPPMIIVALNRALPRVVKATFRTCRALNVAFRTTPRPSVDLRLRHRRAGLQEVEVAALVGLRDVLQVQRAVAAAVLRGRLLPVGAALLQLLVGHLELETAPRDVQLDQVAGADQRQRPPDVALRRDVQHAGAVAGAGHARIGDADHVADPLLQDLLR